MLGYVRLYIGEVLSVWYVRCCVPSALSGGSGIRVSVEVARTSRAAVTARSRNATDATGIRKGNDER